MATAWPPKLSDRPGPAPVPRIFTILFCQKYKLVTLYYFGYAVASDAFDFFIAIRLLADVIADGYCDHQNTSYCWAC